MRRSFFVLAVTAALACEGSSDPGGGGSSTGEGAGGDAAQGGGGGGLGGAGGVDDPGAIRVMTWNLEDFPKTASTISAVQATLAAERPDVVGLQEIPEDDDAVWQSLDDALPEYDGFVAFYGDGFARVGVLYRPDRVTVDDVRMEFASNDWAFPRPMLAARVAAVAAPEHDFELGVVHLKAQLDEESTERRRAACLALNTWVGSVQAEKSDDDVVIVGDFNDELTDPEQWNVFGPLLAPADGGFLTLSLEQGGGYTYIPFDSFIDHVHVRGASLHAASSAEVLALDATVPDYLNTVSDHRPVIATLRFDTAGP